MSEHAKRELAEVDYVKGMKYTEIADKYGVSINTVKSWKQRHKWERTKAKKCVQSKSSKKKGATRKSVQTMTSERQKIECSLLDQLRANGTYQPTYIDLVKDYMKFWDIKNKLISDIEVRGVQIRTQNSNGNEVYKKNESVGELPKYNAQMNKLLNELGLNALNVDGGEGDDI